MAHFAPSICPPSKSSQNRLVQATDPPSPGVPGGASAGAMTTGASAGGAPASAAPASRPGTESTAPGASGAGAAVSGVAGGPSRRSRDGAAALPQARIALASKAQARGDGANG